jgi:hypothetical protein
MLDSLAENQCASKGGWSLIPDRKEKKVFQQLGGIVQKQTEATGHRPVAFRRLNLEAAPVTKNRTAGSEN